MTTNEATTTTTTPPTTMATEDDDETKRIQFQLHAKSRNFNEDDGDDGPGMRRRRNRTRRRKRRSLMISLLLLVVVVGLWTISMVMPTRMMMMIGRSCSFGRKSTSIISVAAFVVISESSFSTGYNNRLELQRRRRTRRSPLTLLTTTRRRQSLNNHHHQHQQQLLSLLFSSSSLQSSSSDTRIESGNESTFEDDPTAAAAATATVAVEEEEEDDEKQRYDDTDTDTYYNDATLEEKTFSQLYEEVMPLWLLERLQANGYIYPTSIQRRALDTFFFGESDSGSGGGSSEGGDTDDGSSPSSPNSMVIQAQTGSGKTLTYLLPILSKLEERSSVQAMIVVPTRELGLQVAAVAKRLVGGAGTTTATTTTTTTKNKKKKFLIMNLLQGSQLKRQRAWAWAETPQVVIGTPPELLDMVRYGGLPRISSCRTVVVDEVDACLVHKSGESLINTQRGSGSGGGSGKKVSTATLSSSLHELLSKYLSPTFVDNDDERDLIDGNGDGQDTIVVVGDAGGRRKGKAQYQYRTQRQTLFCSATIPQHRYFIKQCKSNAWTLEEPVFVSTTAREALPPTLRHGYMVCSSQDQKASTLRRVLRKIMMSKTTNTSTTNDEGGGDVDVDSDSESKIASETKTKKALVFMDPNRPIENIASLIERDLTKFYSSSDSDSDNNVGPTYPSSSTFSSSSVSILRFEDSLSQRADATKAFAAESDSNDGGSNGIVDNEEGTDLGNKSNSSGGFRVLLTTDLAARGLDLQGVTHVIHLDLPKDADTYLHRSGRAGRLGRKGQVVSILSEDQEFVLQRLSNELQLDIQCVGRQKKGKK